MRGKSRRGMMKRQDNRDEEGRTMLITIDHNSKRPIYEQLEERIRGLVEQGRLRPQEKLPSVRALAKQLQINPNTVQRVYASLEQGGIIYSVRGKGNFICDSPLAGKAQRESAISFFEKAVLRLKRSGVDCETAFAIVQKFYRE